MVRYPPYIEIHIGIRGDDDDLQKFEQLLFLPRSHRLVNAKTTVHSSLATTCVQGQGRDVTNDHLHSSPRPQPHHHASRSWSSTRPRARSRSKRGLAQVHTCVQGHDHMLQRQGQSVASPSEHVSSRSNQGSRSNWEGGCCESNLLT
jgi:hypothetical protein